MGKNIILKYRYKTFFKSLALLIVVVLLFFIANKEINAQGCVGTALCAGSVKWSCDLDCVFEDPPAGCGGVECLTCCTKTYGDPFDVTCWHNGSYCEPTKCGNVIEPCPVPVVPPTPTPAPSATPGPGDGVGQCGSCDCGFPIAECYNSPEFGCVHDLNCVGSGSSAKCSIQSFSPAPFAVKTGETATLHASVKTENSGGFWWPCNDTDGCYGLLCNGDSPLCAGQNVDVTRKPLNGCILTSGRARGTGYWDCTFGVTGTNRQCRDRYVGLTLNVYVSGKSQAYGDGDCNGSVTVNSLGEIVPQDAWWQTADGDVLTNGELTTPISVLCGALPTSNKCQVRLIRDMGSGTLPGVAAYGSNYDFSAGFEAGDASSQRWLAKTTISSKVYGYDYFSSRAPLGLNDIVADNIASSDLAGGGTPINGYTWYKRTGDLTLSGDANFAGGRKVILIVDGELTIRGRVIIQAPGNDFFMAVARGNINVDPAVSTVYSQDFTNPASLQGIYVTDGLFKTGVGGEQFSLKGSIVALAGIKFERNIGDPGNTLAPSDFIQYDPALTYAIPHEFYKTSIVWHEVAP